MQMLPYWHSFPQCLQSLYSNCLGITRTLIMRSPNTYNILVHNCHSSLISTGHLNSLHMHDIESCAQHPWIFKTGKILARTCGGGGLPIYGSHPENLPWRSPHFCRCRAPPTKRFLLLCMPKGKPWSLSGNKNPIPMVLFMWLLTWVTSVSAVSPLFPELPHGGKTVPSQGKELLCSSF